MNLTVSAEVILSCGKLIIRFAELSFPTIKKLLRERFEVSSDKSV